MTENKVKLDGYKTEVMSISPCRMSTSHSMPDSFATCNTSVPFSDTINHLGLLLTVIYTSNSMPSTMSVQLTLNVVVSIPFVIS